jgi:AP-3 complex subunit beta
LIFFSCINDILSLKEPRASKKKKSRAFYSDEDSEKTDDSLENSFILDPDHELLLRSCLPLLQSRNSAVL